MSLRSTFERRTEDPRKKGRYLTTSTKLVAGAIAAMLMTVSGSAIAQDEEHGDTHGTPSHHESESHQGGLSYDFFELKYIDTEAEFHEHGHEGGHTVEVPGDGFAIEGSVGIAEHFNLFAGYTDVAYDSGAGFKEVEAGIGAHVSPVHGLDLLARVGYVYEDAEHHGTENGYVLSVGFRKHIAIGRGAELYGRINHVELVEGEQSYELGLEFHIGAGLALGVAAEKADESTSYFLTLRYYFGE